MRDRCKLLEVTTDAAIHCCPEPSLLLNVFSLFYKKTGSAAAVTVSLSCFSDAGCGVKLQLEEKKEWKQKKLNSKIEWKRLLLNQCSVQETV